MSQVLLKRLYVRNFRNLHEVTVECASGMNEIIGENAQGKTSLLEAMYLCMTGASFRTLHLSDLIKHGTHGFFVEVMCEKEGVSHKIALSYDGEKRRVFLNSTLCESSSILLGLVPGVVSTPEDGQLIKGPPATRRRFLDLQISQHDPLYVRHLVRYSRALKQRNSLLKSKTMDAIGAFEQELAHSAAYIVQARKQAVSSINLIAGQIFKEFSFNAEIAEYTPHFGVSYSATYAESQTLEEIEQYLINELKRKRIAEMAYGTTLVGPHRDELIVTLDHKVAKDFASEGQKRLSALALRLAEWRRLQEELNIVPVMLIDDFGAFLDTTRASMLFEACQGLGQVFITAHTSYLKDTASIQTFTMEAGKVSRT